ncbi:carbohydrate ABC transporter permease [Mameliella alba]|uniref:Inositol transport system permease protein n=1 Tax=Mameliella alba TaxID=561184 RepID=A0A0B3SMF1_9RHOB|nr:sugar ABC transporter permease [Mameliella alba]KHQ51719.1 Inositol transport system permease protein [Mameliella alba]
MARNVLHLEALSEWRGIGGAGRLSVAFGTIPALLLIFVFIGLPGLGAVRLSLYRWAGIGEPQFIGLDNYESVLGDPEIWTTMRITLIYAVLCSVGIVIISAVLASAVSSNVKGSAFYKIVWFLPGLAPAAAVSIFWTNAFRPDNGVVNIALGALGFDADNAWLAEASSALYPTVFVTIWVSVGFAFLILLGAMQQIPQSLTEAAVLDGASPRERFFTITLPLIRPTLVVLLVLEFIWAFNNFTVIWAMTKGGPGTSTTTLPVLVYQQAFQFTSFGTAATLAVIGGSLLFILGMIGLRLSQSRQTS